MFQLKKNNYYGLLCGLLNGICFVIDKSLVLKIGPIVYMFWVFLLSSMAGLLFNPKIVFKKIITSKSVHYKLIFLSAVTYTLFNFCIFSAYASCGEVGKIDAIGNTQTFLLIPFEYVILRHKQNVKRKFASAIIAYLGILLLSQQ